MTMKMIAIGILALLGLSSVMSPKAFRMFLGGFAACCLVFFIGIVAADRNATGTPGKDLLSKVLTSFGKRPKWEDLVAAASSEILDAAEGDANAEKAEFSPNDLTDEPSGASKPVEPVTIQILRIPKESRSLTVEKQILRILATGLKNYQENSREIGVDRLTVEDMHPNLVKVIPLPKTENGNRGFLLGVIPKQFVGYVRLEGRKLVMKERLELAAYLCVAFGAVLCLTYGILKVLNRRKVGSRELDYLRESEISLI